MLQTALPLILAAASLVASMPALARIKPKRSGVPPLDGRVKGSGSDERAPDDRPRHRATGSSAQSATPRFEAST